jgi:hypothetical protein
MKVTARSSRPAVIAQPSAVATRRAPQKPLAPQDTFVKWVERANAAKDKPFDGKLVGAGAATFPKGTPLAQIPGVQPDGRPSNGSIVYVNGMLTPLSQQLADMKAIANTTGAQVLGVHNSTEGFVADGLQSASDVAGVGRNAAVDTLAEAMLTELKAGRAMHVFAHSQGAIITQRALRLVRDQLGPQADEKLKLLTIETFGGAGGLYPDGPKYVHYINKRDLVPNLFGIGWDGSIRNGGAGKGAELRYFDFAHPDQILQHLLDTAYLPQRK